MTSKEKLRERFLRDPLPRRLGGLPPHSDESPHPQEDQPIQA